MRSDLLDRCGRTANQFRDGTGVEHVAAPAIDVCLEQQDRDGRNALHRRHGTAVWFKVEIHTSYHRTGYCGPTVDRGVQKTRRERRELGQPTQGTDAAIARRNFRNLRRPNLMLPDQSPLSRFATFLDDGNEGYFKVWHGGRKTQRHKAHRLCRLEMASPLTPSVSGRVYEIWRIRITRGNLGADGLSVIEIRLQVEAEDRSWLGKLFCDQIDLLLLLAVFEPESLE